MSQWVLKEEVKCQSIDDTHQLAGRWLKTFKPGSWIALEGDLGAGKSTFVRELLKSVGWKNPVPSPTYLLIQEYDVAGQLYIHMDAFRLQGNESDAQDIYDWNSADAAQAIVFVEWWHQSGISEGRFNFKILASVEGHDGESQSRRFKLFERTQGKRI